MPTVRQISRPDVNVLEQLAVNRPQVILRDLCGFSRLGSSRSSITWASNEVVLGITQFGMRSSADPVL